MLKNSRVLVTGARGFIARHLCQRLSREGAEVFGAIRHASDEPDGHSEYQETDLTDAAAVRRLVQNIRPDFVFHLASVVTGSRDRKFVLPTFQNNLSTTINLLVAIAEFGCSRMILAGSQETPSAVSAPCSPYAASKLASSVYASMFHALYKTPVVTARIFMVYGPAQLDLTKLVPYVITSLLQSTPPRLSSGIRLVDWIYVDDVVGGLIAMAKAPGIDGQVIDLGSGVLTSIRDVVTELVRLTDSKVVPLFGAVPDRPLEVEAQANLQAAREYLDWEPSVSLTDGLRLTVQWYQERFSPARSAHAAG